MTTLPNAEADARADRRTIVVAIGVMLALVLFGVSFASLFASTNCRRLGPDITTAVTVAARGAEARDLLTAAGVAPTALDAATARYGTLASAVRLPFDAPLRIGDAPVGVADVLVTGDGLALADATGDLTGAATFRRDVTVVGDGVAVFALVVGNTLTGQVDALRPLVPGVDGIAEGACVDTSAVGSPLSFLHDARGGELVGLRTDEDGSEAVLELRDHVRGRVWAPTFALPRAPAGLQGSRTSGALGPDTVVVARRLADTDLASGSEPGAAVRAATGVRAGRSTTPMSGPCSPRPSRRSRCCDSRSHPSTRTAHSSPCSLTSPLTRSCRPRRSVRSEGSRRSTRPWSRSRST